MEQCSFFKGNVKQGLETRWAVTLSSALSLLIAFEDGGIGSAEMWEKPKSMEMRIDTH